MAGWSAARRLAESPREETSSVSLRFRYFYRKGVSIAEHVGAEHHPLLVRREAHIRFQPVGVLRHIDQLLSAEHAGLHEFLLVELALELDGFRTEEIDPLPVFGLGHLPGVAAIAREQFAVSGDVEVNRPFVALQVIALSLIHISEP